MESKTIIEENFTTTKDLESLFIAMNKVSLDHKKLSDILQGHKDDIIKILTQEKLDNITKLNSQIKEIINSFGAQFKEIFEYNQLNENLQFVKNKLEERRKNLIDKLTTIPLDNISKVEDFLLYGYNNTQIVLGDRLLRIQVDTKLDDILSSKKDKGLEIRLLNGLKSQGIKTVGELIAFWDLQENDKSLPYNFYKIRNIGKNTIHFLGIVMKDIIFLKYTKEDSIKIQQLLEYK